ncbi:hypothetical protein KAX29_05905 [candidate division WOR-3 bacterium]|nr:hypothetical protein [candidate division WOR-3 bacterium]
MEKHVTILGVLYIVFGALGILATIIVSVAVVGGGLLSGEQETIAVTSIVGPIIAFFLILVSAPGIIGGIGLLNRQAWARILVLVLGFLKLINIPFGTILGIYTIWVLMKKETEQLFATEAGS